MAVHFLSLKPAAVPFPFPPLCFPPTSSFPILNPLINPQNHPSLNHHSLFSRGRFPSFCSNGGGAPPETECPVPLDQQPVNEYQALSGSFPFSWASGDLVEYCSRLLVTGASFALFVGLPVSWFGSVAPESDPLRRVLAAASSGVFAVTLAVLRMYLGWAYVGNRLLSATVEYEETGWYDGQIWVKTAEMLARDRLLGSFSVKPILSRLKNTLVILATSLFVCVLVLTNTGSDRDEVYPMSGAVGRTSVPGVYNEESARSFEPDAFCGEPSRR